MLRVMRMRSRRLTDDQATATNLRATLFKLIENTTEKDTVIVFLAGHGLVRFASEANNQTEEYYFATHEADPKRLPDTALRWTALQTMLKSISAKRILLFLDACHSAGSLGGQQADSTRLAEALVKRSGVMVFASSRGPEYSYELDDKQHGAFTAALLEGIGESKAANRRGIIDPISLLAWLRERVPELTGNRQTPNSPLFADFGEPFPLARAGQ
jgi:uncharacterized caspase-like protein